MKKSLYSNNANVKLKKKFYENPSVNPETGRFVKQGGMKYHELVEKYGDPYFVKDTKWYENKWRFLHDMSVNPETGRNIIRGDLTYIMLMDKYEVTEEEIFKFPLDFGISFLHRNIKIMFRPSHYEIGNICYHVKPSIQITSIISMLIITDQFIKNTGLPKDVINMIVDKLIDLECNDTRKWRVIIGDNINHYQLLYFEGDIYHLDRCLAIYIGATDINAICY